MRKPFLYALTLALGCAAAIAWAARPMPVAERVTRIEAQTALPEMANRLRELPAGINAIFLDYADDRELVLNARLALLRYPDKTETVLTFYGTQPAFKAVFKRYGPTVVPPIHYFIRHDWLSLHLRHAIAGWFSDDTPAARQAATSPEKPGSDTQTLSPIERGRYAIAFIGDQGHDFLGQFVTYPEGVVSRVQSERLMTFIKRFLTSGITSLETKWRREQELSTGDYAWAAVDILAPIAIFKAARIAKVAQTAKVAKGSRLAARTVKSARAGRLARVGAGFLRVARAGAKPITAMAVLGAGGYVLMHPSMLTSMADGLATVLDLPAWPVRFAIWFAVLLPLFLLLRFLYRWTIRPARWVLRGFTPWVIDAVRSSPHPAHERT